MHQAQPVEQWFGRWLAYHKRLNPHKGWPEYESMASSRAELYEGWIAAFRRYGIDQAAAAAISQTMQAQPSAWPEHHLGIITGLAPEATRKIRDQAEARRRAEERDQAEAMERRREELRERWEQLPRSERAQIRAEVEREHPELMPFRRWIEILCVEELASRHAPPRSKKSRPKTLQLSV